MLKLPENTLTRFSLVIATLSLAACGGGGSGGGSSADGGDPGPVATAVKPGIFNTTITYDSGDTDPEAFTVLSPSGKYAIFNNSLAGTFGTLTIHSDDKFSGNGTKVFSDETETWQSIDGFLEGSANSSEEQKFSATFTTDTAEPGVDSEITGIRFNQLSDLPVTMDDLYAIYSLSDSAMTVTIEPDGTVNGSTTDGCAINGAISIPDPAYNIFEGNLLFQNCPDSGAVLSEQRNGDYPIVGYSFTQGGSNWLVFAGKNSDSNVMTLFSGSTGTN